MACAFSITLFAVSLLFKAACLGLPGVLMVLDVYPLGRQSSSGSTGSKRLQWHIWLEKVPYVVLSLIFGVLAMVAKKV